jgi:uncharacterized protein (DUF952 family)
VVILHMAARQTWAHAQGQGAYTADTLATQGFIHCSTPAQVLLVANGIYRGRTDLVLLEIDGDRLPEPPRFEPGDPTDPESMRFPHVYGPIPLAAVVAVHQFQPGADGLFAVPVEVGRATGS